MNTLPLELATVNEVSGSSVNGTREASATGSLRIEFVVANINYSGAGSIPGWIAHDSSPDPPRL